MMTLPRPFFDHRIEVLSGISGPSHMTSSINAFVQGINRSILHGLFGKKPPTPKDDKSYKEVGLSRGIPIEDNLKERGLLGRYNY